MILTEQEAKDKWCPFSRLMLVGGRGENSAAHNRGKSLHGDFAENPFGCRCIASQCMAWRHSHFEGTGELKALGYCGLAGKILT